MKKGKTMKHSKPAKSAIWLVLILVLITFSHLQPVWAGTSWIKMGSGKTHNEKGEENGHYVIWLYTDDDDDTGDGDGFLYEVYDENGHITDEFYYTMEEWENRNKNRSPDDNDTSKPTPESIRDAIRRFGTNGHDRPKEKAKDPISSLRRAHGEGLDPLWNPPEENARPAPGSPSPRKKTPGSIRDKARRGHRPVKRSLGDNNTPSVSETPGFGGMGTRDDNQPERVNPVPQLRTMTHKQQMAGPDLKSLRILPVKLLHNLNAPVHIQIKNTPFSRLPFELRYRAGATEAYKTVASSRHEFSRKNGQTVLTLHPDRPGQYQVRFRANHKSSWTSWQSFQVTGPNKVARLARNIKLNPAAARAINPQPEPPGKNARMLHTTMQLPIRTVENISASNGLTAKPTPIVAPKVQSPHNGQKFMLAGKSMHIKARISHANGQKIGVQVQRKQKGNFVNMQKGIQINQGKMETTVDIPIFQTGSYRIRVSNGSKGAFWGDWTTFYVDRLMKNTPCLNTKTPNQPINTPGIGAKITM